MLDQPIILLLIFFSILITCVLDVVLKFCLGHLWELKNGVVRSMSYGVFRKNNQKNEKILFYPYFCLHYNIITFNYHSDKGSDATLLNNSH